MSKPDRRFIYLLSVAHRRVQHWTRDRYGEVTASQAGVLFLLGRPEGVLVGEVARALGVGAPAATGLVERMEAAGLIERQPDPRDGRAWRLFLTELGQAARTAAKTRATEMTAKFVDGFTEAELDTVARWLDTVQARFSKEGDV